MRIRGKIMTSNVVTENDLRKFGFVLSFGFVGLFGTLLPICLNKPLALWSWILGIILLILSFLKAKWLNVIYVPWMKIGHIMGWVNTRLILGVIFFFLITPCGLLMRLLRKDPMNRQYDKTLASYRKQTEIKPISHMEKPFS